MLKEAKHKLGTAGFLLYIGFAAASYLDSGFCLILFTAIIAASVIVFIMKKAGAAIFVALCGLPFLIYSMYLAFAVEPCIALYGTVCPVTAEVLDVTHAENDTVRMTVRGTADGKEISFSLFASDNGYSAGDIISAEVKFSELTESAYFNEAGYSYGRGIFVRAAAKEIPEIIGHNDTGIAGLTDSYSDYLKMRVSQYLTGDEAGMIKAMFFGDRRGLTAENSESFRKCGLLHLTAVSGMHLSLVVNLIVILLDAFGLHSRRRLKFAAVVIMTAACAFFFGFSASVCRSGLMMIVYYGALPLKRKLSPIDSLGFAVTVILLSAPCACRDMGLLLSVCGTFGLGYIAPKISASIKLCRNSRIADALVSAVCASLCTLPAAVLIFGGASLVSPIVSVICYPFFAFIMIIMLVFTATGGIFAEPLLFAAGIAAKVMKAVLSFFGAFRYGYINFEENTVTFIASAAVLYAAAAFFICGRKYAVRSAVISLCLIVALTAADKLIKSPLAKVTVWSDGSSGMVTIETDSGISLLSTDNRHRLYTYSLRALTDSCSDRYALLAVMQNERYDVYARGFDSLPCLGKYSGGSMMYDINGDYSVVCDNGIMTAEINGITLSLAPAGTENLSSDIIVYSGYKKQYGNDGGTRTVFCDRRYTECENNAYYKKTVFYINKDGEFIERK